MFLARRALGRLLAFGGVACAITAGWATFVSPACGAHRGVPPVYLPVVDYSSVPPPPLSPHLLHQFWHLYTTYHSSKANASMPFSQWLIVNGVTDPHAFAAMVWLYQWYARNHEVV